MIDPNFYTTQHIELEVAELDIDEGLKDVILTTLERYEALKAKIAEIEKKAPNELKHCLQVKRSSDQSVQLVFASARTASVFEQYALEKIKAHKYTGA